MAIHTGSLTVAMDNGGLGIKGSFHLFLRGPPVRPLDLGHPLANELFRRGDVVQFARVFPEKLGLVGVGQLALAHRFNRPPRVVAVVVVNIGGPRKNVLVELRQARRRGLIAFKAGDTVFKESLAGQALRWCYPGNALVGFVLLWAASKSREDRRPERALWSG